MARNRNRNPARTAYYRIKEIVNQKARGRFSPPRIPALLSGSFGVPLKEKLWQLILIAGVFCSGLPFVSLLT